jgi:hypothetical protein
MFRLWPKPGKVPPPLPPPLPSCRHAVAALAPLPTSHRAATTLLHCRRCRRCTAIAAELPLRCLRGAATATKLPPPPPPRCHRRQASAATAALPLPPPSPCCPKLPLPPPSCPPTPSCRCRHSAAVLPPTLPSCPPQPSCSCRCHTAVLLPPPPSCPPPQSCPLLPGCRQAAGCDIFGGVAVCGVWMCDISSAFFWWVRVVLTTHSHNR